MNVNEARHKCKASITATPPSDKHFFVLGRMIYRFPASAGVNGNGSPDPGEESVYFPDGAQNGVFHNVRRRLNLIDRMIHGAIDARNLYFGAFTEVLDQISQSFGLFPRHFDDINNIRAYQGNLRAGVLKNAARRVENRLSAIDGGLNTRLHFLHAGGDTQYNDSLQDSGDRRQTDTDRYDPTKCFV
jgi:hypothetical protein